MQCLGWLTSDNTYHHGDHLRYHCHPIVSCSSKIQNGLHFWCRLTQVVLEKRLLNGCRRHDNILLLLLFNYYVIITNYYFILLCCFILFYDYLVCYF